MNDDGKILLGIVVDNNSQRTVSRLINMKFRWSI